MKRILMLIALLSILGVAAQAQSFTWPYIFLFQTTCSPQGCFESESVGAGQTGSVTVFAQQSCASGARPYVEPGVYVAFCALPTFFYAYATISGVPPTPYFDNNEIVWAQTLEGLGYIYYILPGGGGLMLNYELTLLSDCYDDAIRYYVPANQPC